MEEVIKLDDYQKKAIKAAEYIGLYQETLYKLLESLSGEEREFLVTLPNPHIAMGFMETHVCKDGVVVRILNNLESIKLPFEVSIDSYGENPNHTMLDLLNQNNQLFFGFIDPISKAYWPGHTLAFEKHNLFHSNLIQILIEEKRKHFVPLASKVFLMGWGYLEKAESTPEELAHKDLSNAFARVKLEDIPSARALLVEYRNLLNTAQNEAELQSFLEYHPEFIYPSYEICKPKPSLAGKRQPDFGFQIRGSGGPDWVFVEIEKPDKKIFTSNKDFQFTSHFTQAKGQLLQWDTLISHNISFYAQEFSGLYKPKYHLIYGRDSEINEEGYRMLQVEFSESNNREFSTYDDLARRFEKTIENIFRTHA